ncbi:Piwi domain-containing protein [Gigaspora rosea]|uniref:Piwi domain-containing protein n=1 Tax=Gigaspora rosea TaxID=44941 RepID=A0A397UPN3_9GLOM|nr:Piwi domain-containing protein [Gigaspora rosea]
MPKNVLTLPFSIPSKKKLSTRYKDKVEANFAINSPQHMVFTADVYYSSKEDKKKGQPSVSAVCGSMNDNLTEFSCRYRINEKLRHDVDIIENLNKMVLELFKQHKVKGNLLPEIIFYRDGIGETQFETVKTDKLEPLLVALEKYYKFEKLPPPKLTFMIIQKRHHARFKLLNGKNCKHGIVVDTEIVISQEFSFYLQSHT